MDLHHRGFGESHWASTANHTALTPLKLTVVIGTIGFVFMRSFPDRAKSKSLKFLTEDERLCILARVNQDRGDADAEKFNIKKWARSGLDWKIWAYGKLIDLMESLPLLISTLQL